MNVPQHDHAVSCAHRPARKLSRKALNQALEAARTRSTEQGVRWTAPRERALELVLEANGPVKAYDLVPTFKAGSTTAPPTIYRALETLVELGLVHRIPSLNAYTACHAHGSEHAASFLICDCCGGVEEIVLPSQFLREAIAGQSEFAPESITLEAHGRCDRCQV